MQETEIIQAAIPLLLSWYPSHKKNLPWRRGRDAYAIWISEIMLQQTRTGAVILYYERFLAELPDVYALAQADDNRLMKLWEGLGYYSRARNLKKAAQKIVSDYDGNLPQDLRLLRSLPGIGDYTAGAVASLAFGLPEPAVDGNVLRVCMRLFACSDDVLDGKTKKRVAELLRSHYPAGEDATTLTQALMELGENICIPNGTPLCEKCPLAAICQAKAGEIVALFPYRSPKAERRAEERTVFLLVHNGKYAIRRRPEQGLLAGLWEFPSVAGNMSAEEATVYWEKQGISCTATVPLPSTKHIFTHIEWHMTGYQITCAEEINGFLWLSPREIRAGYALPSAFRAYERLLS